MQANDSTQVSTDVSGNTSTLTSLTQLQLVINNNIKDSIKTGLSLVVNRDHDIEKEIVESCNSLEGTRARAWMITILNYSEEECNILMKLDYQYLIWQQEICPTTKTPHLHAFVYYKNPVIWPKRFLPRARIEKVRDIEKCIAYCSKESTRSNGPFESGIRPKQGRRKDLEEHARKYLATSEKEFAEENPDLFVRYYRGLRELRNVQREHRDRNTPPVVTWFWGKAGAGKTSKAVDSHKSFYIKDGTCWWDGYEQQEAIIIDDFDGKWPYRDLLRLLDRYPYQGQVKGGYVKINSPFIYITCEHQPGDLWEGNELNQVTRRITTIERMDGTDIAASPL